MTAALYYVGVELKNLQHTENTQRTHREFNYRDHSKLWIAGLSGPILMNNIISYSKTCFNKDMT